MDMTFEEWLQRVEALKIRRSHGLPAPYQPVMLLAVVVLVRKARFADNRFTLSELEATFRAAMRALAPKSPQPDTTKMPFKALAKAGAWSFHAPAGGAVELRAALRRNEAPSYIAGLVDYGALPPQVFRALVGPGDGIFQAVTRIYTAYREVFSEHGLTGDEGISTLMAWLGGSHSISDEAPRSMDERGVEELLVNRWRATPFASQGLILGPESRQYPTTVNNIDLLAADRTSENYLVVELKRNDHSDKAVGQISRYMGWVKTHRADGDVERVRGAIVTNTTGAKLESAVEGHGNVELWRYDDSLRLSRVL